MRVHKKISAYNNSERGEFKYIVMHYIGAVSSAKNNAIYFAGGESLAATMNIRTESSTPHISAGTGTIYTNGEVKQAHAGGGNLIDAFTLSCIFETD